MPLLTNIFRGRKRGQNIKIREPKAVTNVIGNKMITFSFSKIYMYLFLSTERV